MKKSLLSIVAFLPFYLFAQETKYTIQGELGVYDAPAKMYLQYRVKGQTMMDSVTLKKGKFQFKGNLDSMPVNAVLAFSKKGMGFNYNDYRSLYLVSGKTMVMGSDSLTRAEIRGTKVNEDNERYRALLKPTRDSYRYLAAQKKVAGQQDISETAYNRATKAIELAEAETTKKFIQDNPSSYISLVALENYAYSADYNEISILFAGLLPAIQKTETGKKIAERLPKLKAVALGATAPEFAEADTMGNMISLSSFRGQYVLIDFWASWCGPCRRENPNIVKLFKEYKNEKFTIIGVSLDRATDREKWMAAIHKDGLIWTQVSDLNFWDSKTAVLYAVRGIPQNFLLDPDGKIIGKNLRGNDLTDKLSEIFKR